MATLQHLHRIMTERRDVQLSDGRVGRVVRVDTLYPDNTTTVTIWTDSNIIESSGPESSGPRSGHPDSSGPGITKVALSDIVGEAERQSA
jgi:hypothetical protein